MTFSNSRINFPSSYNYGSFVCTSIVCPKTIFRKDTWKTLWIQEEGKYNPIRHLSNIANNIVGSIKFWSQLLILLLFEARLLIRLYSKKYSITILNLSFTSMLIYLLHHPIFCYLKFFLKKCQSFFSLFHMWLYLLYFGLVLQKVWDTRSWISIKGFKWGHLSICVIGGIIPPFY